MKIDVNRYTLLIPIIKTFIENNQKMDDSDLLSNITTMTQAPLVAVGYLIADAKGMSPELQGYIDSLIKFYQYDEVILLKKDDT